jgi:hypothetical protein
MRRHDPGILTRWSIILTLLFAGTNRAPAYAVDWPASLDDLTAKADIVFKGTVISSGTVDDASFAAVPNFSAFETKFKVVSVLKGTALPGALQFRHYDFSPHPVAYLFQPQHYHFEPGRSYLVFAKKTGSEPVFREIWDRHTLREDQGVLLCPDDQPLPAKPVPESVWNELTAMLAGKNADDVIYAIHQLNQMSRATEWQTDAAPDFDREKVTAAIHDLLDSPDAGITETAMAAIGGDSPYFYEENVVLWISNAANGHRDGTGASDPAMKNPGGKKYWKDLAAIASSASRPEEVRGLAIRALGHVGEPSLRKLIDGWVTDSSVTVRTCATLLLADFPGEKATAQLARLADDPEANVRISVVYAIGYSQQSALANILARLLTDKDAPVRSMAALGLVSLPPSVPAVAEILQANVKNQEFGPVFVNALARENPGRYLDDLAREVSAGQALENWTADHPVATAWKLLLHYLQAQKPADLKTGKLDRYLEAIEKARGMDPTVEPRDIYAFYLQRGLTGRAKNFRAAESKNKLPYDIEKQFNEVDANPLFYKGE